MFESKQFFFSGQYLTAWQLPVVLLSFLPRKQNLRVLAPLYPFQVQLLQTIAFLKFQKKCLNLSSSPTAINTSQFDNCQ